MKVTATILAENCVFHQPGAVAEHGLAIFLETEAGNFLLDTGQGKAVVQNALALGIDLKRLQGVILSHHHFDHTGGLAAVLDVTGPVAVYAHPDLFKESYSLRGGKERYIGVPFPRPLLAAKGASFQFNRDFREIAPGLWLTGEIPRRTDYELGDQDQVLKTEAGFVKDPLPDDQSVVVETAQGLSVILGCCHAGIINTLLHIQEKMGRRPIDMVIGGTHLGPVSEAQQEKSLAALQGFDIGRLGVSHCTGLKISTRLSQAFGDRFFFCNVGTVVQAG